MRVVGKRFGAKAFGAKSFAPKVFRDRPPTAGDAEMTLAIAVGQSPVMTSDVLAISVDVSNPGLTVAIVNAVVTVTMSDASSVLDSSTAPGWTVTDQGGGVVELVAPTPIAASGLESAVIRMRTPAAADATFTASGSAVADNAPTANDSDSADVQLVDKDATDGRRYPSTIAQWTSLFACKSVTGAIEPSGIYRLQEASGNIADSGSGGPGTLTANGAPLYQQAIADTTRVGVGFNGTVNQRFSKASGTPNPSSTSQSWLWFMRPTHASATRRLAAISGGSPFFALNTDNNAAPKINPNLNGSSVVGASNLQNVYQPIWFVLDRANSVAEVDTAAERVASVYGAVADGIKGLGGVGGTSMNGAVTFGVVFQGAAAEVSSAIRKAILEALGWAIAW